MLSLENEGKSGSLNLFPKTRPLALALCIGSKGSGQRRSLRGKLPVFNDPKGETQVVVISETNPLKSCSLLPLQQEFSSSWLQLCQWKGSPPWFLPLYSTIHLFTNYESVIFPEDSMLPFSTILTKWQSKGCSSLLHRERPAHGDCPKNSAQPLTAAIHLLLCPLRNLLNFI